MIMSTDAVADFYKHAQNAVTHAPSRANQGNYCEQRQMKRIGVKPIYSMVTQGGAFSLDRRPSVDVVYLKSNHILPIFLTIL